MHLSYLGRKTDLYQVDRGRSNCVSRRTPQYVSYLHGRNKCRKDMDYGMMLQLVWNAIKQEQEWITVNVAFFAGLKFCTEQPQNIFMGS